MISDLKWRFLTITTLFTALITMAEGQSGANQDFVEVQECQGINNCATWTFHRNTGLGEWPSGERAVLEITHLDSQHITVRRTDIQGPTKGLEATYEGTAAENGDLGGTFQENNNGRRDSGHWYFVSSQSKSGKQQVGGGSLQQIVECEGRGCTVDNPNRVSWIFNGKREGIATFSTGNQPLTITRLDKTTIVVSRTDTSGPWRGSAVYTGRISGDHIEGTVEYHDPGQSNPRFDNWTGLIGTTPIADGTRAGPGFTSKDVITGLQILDELIKIKRDSSQ